MKGLLAATALLMLSGLAAAKPSPVSDLKLLENETPALVRGEPDTNTGSAAAARERDYFQAPQMKFNAGSFYCPLQATVFRKTRLAQSCE
jgi:hypothetical protein